MYCIFFFKQKTAYEMRISDWSSDVCSSDLIGLDVGFGQRKARRTAVDDRAECGTVAFPPSREAKNASEAVETHARAVLSMNSLRLPNGSSVKKRWRPSMMLSSGCEWPAASLRAGIPARPARAARQSPLSAG